MKDLFNLRVNLFKKPRIKTHVTFTYPITDRDVAVRALKQLHDALPSWRPIYKDLKVKQPNFSMFINHGSHVELNRVLTWLNDPARELQEASQAVPDEHDDPDDLSDDGELSDDSDRSEEEIVATYHPKLRRSVTSRATEVLAFHQCDLYTGKKKHKASSQPQVDHVWEIQLAERVVQQARSNLTTKDDRYWKRACDIFAEALNAEDNLNVTSRAINVGKRGPITSFLNRCTVTDKGTFLRKVSLRTFASYSDSATVKSLLESKNWANIETALCDAFDALDAHLSRDDASSNTSTREVLSSLCETANSLHDALKLNRK